MEAYSKDDGDVLTRRRHFQHIAVKHAKRAWLTALSMNHNMYVIIFNTSKQYLPTEAEENEGSSIIKTLASRLGWNIRRMIHI